MGRRKQQSKQRRVPPLVEQLERAGVRMSAFDEPYIGDPGDEQEHVSRRRAVQVHVGFTLQYRSMWAHGTPDDVEEARATRLIESMRDLCQGLLDEGLIEGFHVESATFAPVPFEADR